MREDDTVKIHATLEKLDRITLSRQGLERDSMIHDSGSRLNWREGPANT